MALIDVETLGGQMAYIDEAMRIVERRNTNIFVVNSTLEIRNRDR